MFCPKCSQQQPSDEMRFCSRCGFPLGAVALLLDNGGLLPQLAGDSTQKRLSARNRMLCESSILTLVTWGLALGATFWWDYGGAFESAAKVSSLVLSVLGLIALLRFLYAFLFVKASPDQQTAFGRVGAERVVLGEPGPAMLPPQRSTPISDYPRRVNTKEMVQRPPSVTENTTRLLDE
jgi:hypothetical protein